MNRTLTLIASLAASCATSLAAADVFFGLEHIAIGDALLVPTPDGLCIKGIGSTGKDGVEVRMPPPPPHRLCVWEIDFSTSSFPSGATLDLRAIADDGSGVPAIACSRHMDLTPGAEQIVFDFSNTGTATIGARYYAGGMLVAEEAGLDPVFVMNGGFPPVITEPCGSVHYDNVTQQWVLDGCIGFERTLGGTPLPACDHWEIFTESATVQYLQLTAVQLHATGTPQIEVLHESYVEVPIPSGCPGDANGDFVVDINDLNAVLGNWGGSGPAGDVVNDGTVDINDLNAVLGNWGQPCA